MYEFCTDALKAKLKPMRDHYTEVEDRDANAEKLNKKNGESSTVIKTDNRNKRHHPYWFSDDVGSNNSGIYELQAIVTHQGRSSSSGHYVGWVRHDGDVWLKYDDDDVTQVTTEDVLRLSGGGDWHCAYVLLYGPKLIEVLGGDNGDVIANQSMDIS